MCFLRDWMTMRPGETETLVHKYDPHTLYIMSLVMERNEWYSGYHFNSHVLLLNKVFALSKENYTIPPFSPLLDLPISHISLPPKFSTSYFLNIQIYMNILTCIYVWININTTCWVHSVLHIYFRVVHLVFNKQWGGKSCLVI